MYILNNIFVLNLIIFPSITRWKMLVNDDFLSSNERTEQKILFFGQG